MKADSSHQNLLFCLLGRMKAASILVVLAVLVMLVSADCVSIHTESATNSWILTGKARREIEMQMSEEKVVERETGAQEEKTCE